MAMTSLNISLPEPLKDYVEGQVSAGDYGTPSEYVRDLIRQDKERRSRQLENELLAALQDQTIEIPVKHLKAKGIVAVLRERTRSK